MVLDKIYTINQVLKEYFELNKSINSITAKDMMPLFIRAGIFPSDQKNGLPIRRVLRTLDEKNLLHLIPYVYAERKLKNTNWFFRRSNNNSSIQTAIIVKDNTISKLSRTHARKDSDEHYVIDLCNNALNMVGLRQHRFDFLLGDSNAKGICSRLPVDVYYPELNLVVEYKEHQHSKSVKHFDKPDIMTVSGVHRGEQRRIYDLRRAEFLPKHGIQLVEIPYEQFDFTRQNKIVRNFENDLRRVKMILKLIN